MGKKTVERLRKKITKENLEVLCDEDQFNEYRLKKLLAWQEDYCEYVSWEKFNDHYIHCDMCDSYNDDICICYAR